MSDRSCIICPRPRKAFTRACVFLLLGAIVNIAVAWGCVWNKVELHGPVAHGFTRTQQPDWYVTICRRPGAIRIYGYEPPPDQAEVWRGQNVAQLVLPDPLQRWSQFNTPPRGNIERLMEDARGWPMVSLRMTYIARADSIDSAIWTSKWLGGIALPPHPPASTLPIWEVRALPLIPIWPNFAINTMFYAGVLWLLIAFPFKVRRWRRTKRGLCPACAYPVGQSPICTECGASLQWEARDNESPVNSNCRSRSIDR